MRDNCLCSIIIPAYNAQEYLEDCLDSICNQFETGSGTSLNGNIAPQIEIIIVDDGSTDGTYSLANSYKSKPIAANIDIKVFKKTNGGVSSARNFGISKATGEYIYFVDADDVLYPNSLSKILKILETKEFDVVRIKNVQINEGITMPHPKESSGEIVQRCSGWEFLNSKIPTYAVWLIFIRRNIIIKNKLTFRENVILHEDGLFINELLPYCRSVCVADSIVYVYIIRNASASHRQLTLQESFGIGLNTSSGFQEIKNKYADQLLKYPGALESIEARLYYHIFIHCLWPQVKYSVTLSEAKSMLKILSDKGFYPINKPIKDYFSVFHAKPLLWLWYLSRYKYIWLTVICLCRCANFLGIKFNRHN